LGTALPELVEVVGDFQQALAVGATVDDFGQPVTSGTSETALKPGVEFHE
jgi:hypothetical protein